ncbi:glycoside hydrolase 3 protein [Coemansia pectinata]|uniref:glucan endo-1,3-beta-D-glucosidase n=1 Tax=Coemansia pectinata TaxID=1052879 RepID=A0A9W8H671_9FUNG|nr:glycoside hydrolase 3 protein [Coemansia pectinata]
MKLTLTLATLATAAAAANQFNGFSYNPKQLKSGACPTVDTVRDDLSVLSKYTNQVRIYSVKDCNQGEPVLRAMENTDWKVQLGMWVSNVESVYEADRNELIRLAGVFDFKKHVSAVIVGNEAIYRKEQTSAQIAAKVRDTKAALTKIGLGSIPVTASETWPYYDPTLVAAVDYVNVHAFPFWEGTPIEGAQDKVFEHIYAIQKLAGSKKVVVGETGWPDAGGNYEAAVPSLANEQRYLKEFICRANLEKIDYIWFSAFDEAWKPVTNASDVETHWGVLKGDKTPKFSSPMYDCKGFVPNTKPSSSSSVSSSASSSASKTGSKASSTPSGHSSTDKSDNKSSDTNNNSDKSSDSQDKSDTSKNSAAWSPVGSGLSAVSIVASMAALAVSALI